VKRVRFAVHTKLSRFTNQVVTLAQKAVVGTPKPAIQRGDGGYADWVIVSIHALKTYLDHPYRRLLDVLYEMPRICGILDLEPCTLPDFTTVCARMQELKMPLWRDLLRLSAFTKAKLLCSPQNRAAILGRNCTTLARSRRSTPLAWIESRRASTTPNGRITRLGR